MSGDSAFRQGLLLSRSSPAGPSLRFGSPPPRTSSRAENNPARHYHKMATYVASEKDVRSRDDEVQECVICLEDFEVGAELALLECFCKFHKVRGVWTLRTLSA